MLKLIVVVFMVASQSSASDTPCDPLCPEVCSYPFPNDFWRDSATGKLTLSIDTFPKDRSGQAVNVDAGGWNQLGSLNFMIFTHIL